MMIGKECDGLEKKISEDSKIRNINRLKIKGLIFRRKKKG